MAVPRPLVILVCGEPVPPVQASRGGFADLIRQAVGEAWPGPWLDVDAQGMAALPEPRAAAGVIVTGSASSVTERAPWMLRAEEYLRLLVRERVTTLGICFGHQLLGQALGGNVSKNPLGREIGTVDFETLTGCPLLSLAGPAGRVNTTHVDTVSDLPPGATVLGRTALDAHAAVRFAEGVWGVQFHPEMDAEVVRGYLAVRRDVLASEGRDVDALLTRADDGVAGRSTLTRFVEIARGG